MERKLNCFHWFASVFYHCQLNDNSSDEDDQEQWIVKEILEDVSFTSFKLSSIDFVENLE